ncbi:MAG: MBL fold metallo-hydrolase [candidate division Zixibacteria bacterium]|nr:MBL fold metallo-hydrolase [candidate division Zixibacteria bacterium]
MLVEKIVVGGLETNCYIVMDEKSKKGIVIDPGADSTKIKKKIEELKVKIEKIILTHGHADHIAALDQLKIYTGARVLIHPQDEKMLSDSTSNLSFLAENEIEFSSVADNLKDGDMIKCGEIEFKVIHTPGHTPGGISLLVGDAIFTGDTLFRGSVGRTDLPGSSWRDLEKSLKKILNIKEDLTVYPGHGPVSNLKWEKENNPFLIELK